jgi:hypothetical protein
MPSDNTYMVSQIDVDCFDVFVSDDGGYTWEYYNSYESNELAEEEGKTAVMFANTRGRFYD